MHGSIRDRLEDLLSPKRPAAGERDLTDHLASCSECLSELHAMEDQSVMLQALRAPEGLEPAPGFYARVMQRIEERAKETIWGALIRSPIFPRVAYASLTVALVLGSYVVASETRDGHLTAGLTAHNDAPVIGDVSQQRDAVLENFASH